MLAFTFKVGVCFGYEARDWRLYKMSSWLRWEKAFEKSHAQSWLAQGSFCLTFWPVEIQQVWPVEKTSILKV